MCTGDFLESVSDSSVVVHIREIATVRVFSLTRTMPFLMIFPVSERYTKRSYGSGCRDLVACRAFLCVHMLNELKLELLG